MKDIERIEKMLDKHELKGDKMKEKIFDKLEANSISMAEVKVEIRDMRKDVEKHAEWISDNKTAIGKLKTLISVEATKTAFVVSIIVAILTTVFALAMQDFF
ncbi:hypothetical protein LCGC14_1734410 [marine sediment metagenome]|uniref:Uncharacterized protein n=1 Tax=marine sediment metagenome TaxID=412755 RepID=A0A0F9K871_9ZZZZ